MAHPDDNWAVYVLRNLVPDLRSGTLTGLALHWYFGSEDYTLDWFANPPTATLLGDPLKVRVDDLLTTLFATTDPPGPPDPLVATLPI
jgi:hypothetical protein